MCAVLTAYGLRLDGPVVRGLDSVLLGEKALGPDAHTVPLVHVRHEATVPSHDNTSRVDDISAVFSLPSGVGLRLDRTAREAVYSGPSLDVDTVAHPYLSPVGAIFGRWLRREAFHAGAFVIAGSAWIVVGGRELGKSSLLATMAVAGHDVVADDSVVSDGDVVFAGPRCVDLRDPTPAAGRPLRQVRDGTRWRLALPHGQASCPVAGWLFLRWGDDLSLARVPASQLLGRLARYRARAHLASEPSVLLRLANRPAWVLTRRRSWDGMAETVDAVMATVAASAPASLAGAADDRHVMPARH
ncbi:MAG: hypothetical protein ACRD0Z_14775 [Acidimicrobiales bacterium]